MSAIPETVNRQTGKKVPTFLTNAFHMISSCNPSIAKWDDDGKSFIVYEKERLGMEEIPKYFKHNQYSSFMRSLNSYKFKKIGVDGKKGVIWHRYSHPGFLKDRIDLLDTIHSPSASKPNKTHAGAGNKTIATLEKENEILKLANGNLQAEIARLQAELATVKANQMVEQKSAKRKFEETRKGKDPNWYAMNFFGESSAIRITSGLGEIVEDDRPPGTDLIKIKPQSIKEKQSKLPKKNVKKPVRLQKRSSSRVIFKDGRTVQYYKPEKNLVSEKPDAMIFRSVSEENRFIELMLGNPGDFLDDELTDSLGNTY